jgi:SAM-dependent methyltransferase
MKITFTGKVKSIVKAFKTILRGRSLFEMRTSSHWDDRYREKTSSQYKIRSWAESGYVLSHYIHPLISGSPDRGWFVWTAENFLQDKPYERALVLGCGCGNVERHAHILDLFEHFDAYDISKAAIQEAVRQSRKEEYSQRVIYRCENFIQTEFPAGAYDAVYMDMTLHHVKELERLLDKIRKTKKREACFILHEYIGPNRFQWSDVQIEEGNRILNLLPENLRVDYDTGEIKRKFERPLLSQMIMNDPSEAIRSADIVNLVSSEFEQLARRDYGGTVLHPLLHNIIHNFRPESVPEHAEALDMLFEEEQKLIKKGVLQSDFALFVLR